MNYKQYLAIRTLIGLLVASIVMVATISSNLYLAISGVFIGILFAFLAKSKFKAVAVDERVIAISGKASRIAYVIVTMLLALFGLVFIFIGKNREDTSIGLTGETFCYIALLLITVYSISYYYFNKKYGAND